MTKFESMDNMNTNFVALSEQELMEMEGGIAPFLLFCYGFGAGVTGTAAVVTTINTVANFKW